ncbi:MAG TPA: DUF1801 domain-containing protein [Micromonosporaceae bacterium]
MGELTEYIAGLELPARTVVDRYRLRAIELVPTAEEGKSYGMAALRYRGRPLISVIATRQGYSVFPFSGSVVAGVVAGHAGLDASKGGIRFSERRPLPDAVFDALVLGRRDEIDAALSPA